MFRTLMLLMAVGALFMSTSGQSLPGHSASATFRTDAKLVLVPVTVVDRKGALLSGLGREAFTVLEDKVIQQIASFTSEDAPCSVGLVLDVSGSMRPSLNMAKDVAHTFFGTANADDEFLLLTVSTQPEAVSGFTTDTAVLEHAIQFTSPGGMTALIDTVYLGLNRMRAAKQPRRALLIVSDGMDNYSRYSKNELTRVALEADVQIYTIIVEGLTSSTSTGTIPFRPALIRKPADQAQENQGPSMLEELSDKTGGLHFRVRSDAEAKEAVIKTGQALRNQYVIGYAPLSADRSGKWHSIQVKLNRHDAKAYTRSGYRFGE